MLVLARQVRQPGNFGNPFCQDVECGLGSLHDVRRTAEHHLPYGDAKFGFSGCERPLRDGEFKLCRLVRGSGVLGGGDS